MSKVQIAQQLRESFAPRLGDMLGVVILERMITLLMEGTQNGCHFAECVSCWMIARFEVGTDQWLLPAKFKSLAKIIDTAKDIFSSRHG